MSINYLKKATKTPETDEAQTREIVVSMLDDIKANGEEAVKKYAEKLDNWTGDFIITKDDIDKAAASLGQRTRDDIQFAYEQVYNFAKKQRRCGRTKTDSRERSRVLCAGRTLCPCRIGPHEHCHCQGRRGSLYCCLLPFPPWGRHSSFHSLCHVGL